MQAVDGKEHNPSTVREKIERGKFGKSFLLACMRFHWNFLHRGTQLTRWPADGLSTSPEPKLIYLVFSNRIYAKSLVIVYVWTVDEAVGSYPNLGRGSLF